MLATKRTAHHIAFSFASRESTTSKIRHLQRLRLHSSTAAVSIQGPKAIQNTLAVPHSTPSAMEPATDPGRNSPLLFPKSMESPLLMPNVSTDGMVPVTGPGFTTEESNLDDDDLEPMSCAPLWNATEEEKWLRAAIVGARALVGDIVDDMNCARSSDPIKKPRWNWWGEFNDKDYSFYYWVGNKQLLEFDDMLEYLSIASVVDKGFVKGKYYDASRRAVKRLSSIASAMADDLAKFNKANKRRIVTVGGRCGESVYGGNV